MARRNYKIKYAREREGDEVFFRKKKDIQELVIKNM